MAQKFSWKLDIKKVDWGSTLKYNLMRAVSAGIVWGFLMLITDPAKNALAALFAPIFFPVIYLFLVTVVVGILSLYARSPLPFGELVAGLTMLFWAFVVAIGDPLIYLLHKRKPGLVPVDQPRLFDFHLIVFVLRNQFQPKSGLRVPVAPPDQIAQASVPPNQPPNSSTQSTPHSSAGQMPVSVPVASGSFFTSKPFIMLVVIAAALCGGVALFKSLSDKTTLSFDFSLDGKGLPSGKVPDVRVDGQPFTSGSKIKMGRHELTVQLQDVEPLEKHYWILFGAKNLGTLPLELSKGSLIVVVNPSPASITVQSAGETVRQGDAPLSIEKLPVGDYTLVIRRGEYEESHSVKIQREQQTKAQIDLNLGSVDLSVEPTNAEFELSGNGRHWQGSLPIHIDDVPAGDYSLLTRRKGWELNVDVSVSRGNTTTNETEFPYGSIELTSDPAGLVISTNGVEIGKTPMSLQELKPGQYTLTASDGENDLMADIDVAPKEAAKHVFVFHYGTVQLSSTPTGATVIRKGKEIGKTPLTLNHIPAGETMVELQLQDYVSTNLPIQAVEGITTNLSAKLISEHYLQAMKQARDAFDASQFTESQKFLAAALESEPNDSAAMELQDEVSKAATKAEEAQKEAERIAEVARKEAEHNQVVSVIEKAINAVGGREAINRFRSFKAVSQTSGKKNGADFALRGTVYIQFPDAIRLDQEVENSPKKLNIFGVAVAALTVNQGKPIQSTFCVTGSGSWEVVPGLLGAPMQISSVGKAVQNQLQESLYLAECTSLVPLLGPDYTLEKLSDSSSAPFNAVAIKVHKMGKADVTLYFDKDSGLLVGLDTEKVDNHDNLVHDSERYSEYRNFSGLMSATITTYTDDANVSSTGTLESLEPLNQYYGNLFSPPNNSQ